jgi:hypothetical protein
MRRLRKRGPGWVARKAARAGELSSFRWLPCAHLLLPSAVFSSAGSRASILSASAEFQEVERW